MNPTTITPHAASVRPIPPRLDDPPAKELFRESARSWFTAALRWLTLCRVCAWCSRRLGGNPLARKSHGICPTCRAGVEAMLEKGQP